MTQTRPKTPAAEATVLYLGLRRSALEWRAELEAAAAAGLTVRVASDADLSHTGLPSDRLGAFDRTAPIETQLAQAASGEPPTAVVCWGDKYVDLTARLAEQFGVRGIGTDAAAVTTDKAAQRRSLEAHGLNPPWRSGTTLDDLREAVAELRADHGGPLVFKAAHCSGGRGIAAIVPGSDLDEIFKLTAENYNGTSSFVVEALVDGTEHSVAGLVADGRAVRILGVTDKRHDGPLTESWAALVPSATDPAANERLRDAAERAVLAAGLRTGGFHVDLRLTDTGPVVLEIGGRLGGDLINSHLIPLAAQDAVRPYEALLDLLARGALLEAVPAPSRGAAMVLLPRAGRATADVLDAALAQPGVTVAADWPGTDTVVAVIVTDEPSDLPAAVADLRGRFR